MRLEGAPNRKQPDRLEVSRPQGMDAPAFERTLQFCRNPIERWPFATMPLQGLGAMRFTSARELEAAQAGDSVAVCGYMHKFREEDGAGWTTLAVFDNSQSRVVHLGFPVKEMPRHPRILQGVKVAAQVKITETAAELVGIYGVDQPLSLSSPHDEGYIQGRVLEAEGDRIVYLQLGNHELARVDCQVNLEEHFGQKVSLLKGDEVRLDVLRLGVDYRWRYGNTIPEGQYISISPSVCKLRET